MSRKTALLACLVPTLVSAAAAPSAGAAVRTMSFRYGPIAMDGFQTRLPKVRVPSPRRDGYVRSMDVRLEYRNGRRVSIRQVMLHHVVFLNDGRWPKQNRGSCKGRHGEPFYGTGEERERLILPPGYGYRVHRGDRWRMQTMLMSHSLAAHRVYVRYTVRFATRQRLTPVRPFWIRANGCRSVQPSYTVDGDGAPGSTSRRSFRWRVPMTGRIVAAGGHLHGGARNMTLNEPACGNRELLDTRPVYAPRSDIVYRIRPILHEPGPVGTRYFLSRTGIPVRRGQILRLDGDYDGEWPRPRVMAIMHVYVAPGRATSRPCAPLPADRRELLLRHDGAPEPPHITVPLNRLESDGRVHPFDELPGPVRTYADAATVHLRNNRFTPAKISLPVGGSVTWSFDDAASHNVLYANGPAVIGTPTARRGQRYRRRFPEPGRYQLFCYLHPITMHQEVIVR